MINPGSKLAGLCKRMLAGVGCFSRELPQTPTDLLNKGFLHNSLQPSIKREKTILDSRYNGDTCHYFRNLITIQTLVSEQDTCVQQYSTSSYYKWLKNKNMQKIKQLTALQESNTSKISTPKSFFISTRKGLQESFLQHKTHKSNDLKWPLAPYLKENFPTTSSSDPRQKDLDRRWGSKHLLISSVEFFENWNSTFIYSKFWPIIILLFFKFLLFFYILLKKINYLYLLFIFLFFYFFIFLFFSIFLFFF